MTKGSIKKLMKDRGYGFIKVEDGREIFFHMSALQGLGFSGLLKGVAVECDVQDDIYNKFKAVNVRELLVKKRTKGLFASFTQKVSKSIYFCIKLRF